MKSFIPYLYASLAFLALAQISFLLYMFVDWRSMPNAIQTVLPMLMGIMISLILMLIIFAQLKRIPKCGKKKVHIRYL